MDLHWNPFDRDSTHPFNDFFGRVCGEYRFHYHPYLSIVVCWLSYNHCPNTCDNTCDRIEEKLTVLRTAKRLPWGAVLVPHIFLSETTIDRKGWLWRRKKLLVTLIIFPQRVRNLWRVEFNWQCSREAVIIHVSCYHESKKNHEFVIIN